jgi:hypothetical protein
MSSQRPHHPYPREHRRSVMFCNQHQRLHRGLPFLGVVLCLRQLGNVFCRVAERDQRFSGPAP